MCDIAEERKKEGKGAVVGLSKIQIGFFCLASLFTKIFNNFKIFTTASQLLEFTTKTTIKKYFYEMIFCCCPII